jgi:chromosomal replication initiation ATPase DnaA
MTEQQYAALMMQSAVHTAQAQRESSARIEKPIFVSICACPTHDEQILIEEFAAMAGCTYDDMLRQDRKKAIATARHVLIHTMREQLKMSYPQIARAIGRDTSTVISAVRAGKKIIDANPSILSAIEVAVRRAKRD